MQDQAKQIEEMTKDLCDIECKGMKCNTCDSYGCEYRMQAEALYNAGYRKQMVGEWIFKEEKDAFFCSLCDQEALIDASFKGIDFVIAELSDFCPHCGAKMKGGAE